ncbi:helix-turn-helix domain-containing protein [uncultured Subdoligranulum sp.]|uniref:helix-turn-helix domain-containing protein n=1 Tax=uncultured Subdoligranulum sp. TaxID=512298 RepID=UPI00260DCDB1|nr:helix-turn-helix transcriptional regulator [uncultured Subdoligranulum sp.]MDD6610074.1 helix-turn-helix transcriptional regulator [Subdoligranulum variabile]
MKTWNDYKDYVKATDPEAKQDLEEVETLSQIVSAMVVQRHTLGLSQRDLAEICGLPQSSVARIESFKTTPNLDTLLKIMNALKLKITITPA